MKILITGGAGYIGTALTQRLASQECVSEVVVYDNLSRANYDLFLLDALPNKVQFIRGDVLDSRGLAKAAAGAEAIVHLAARVSQPFRDYAPHHFEQVNHWGTAEVAYAAQKAEVKRLVYLSSATIYGACDEPVDDSVEPSPRTYYGMSKYKGESHIAALRSIDTHILRCGTVYGAAPSIRLDSFVNKLAFEANFLGKVTVHGSGNQYRPVINIDNAAGVAEQACLGRLPSGVHNLVEDDISIADVVDSLRKLVPSLDSIYVNQDIELRSLRVVPSAAIRPHLAYDGQLDEAALAQELKALLAGFSFHRGGDVVLS